MSAQSVEPAFEAIDALDGYFRLRHRSPTLDGAMPLRAAQHCTPFVEGSGAGVQVWAPRAFLKRTGARVDFVNADARAPTDVAYLAAVTRLHASGFLSDAWRDQFDRGLCWADRHHLYVWTGHVVRPSPGVWLQVGNAHNRRAGPTVLELVCREAERFVPLVIKLDARQAGAELVSLEGELACVVALRAGTKIEHTPLRERGDVAQRVSTYFDRAYFQKKATQPTGKYKRLVAGHVDAPTTPSKLTVVDFGAARLTTRGFHDFIGPDALEHSRRAPPEVGFVEVRAQATVTLSWSGFDWREKHRALSGLARLRKVWRQVCGADETNLVDRYFRYVILGPPIEQVFSLLPWFFVHSQPGWSCLLDGQSFPNVEGQRGVIRSDRFHQAPAVFRVLGRGTVTIAAGAPILRVTPLPTNLLRPVFRVSAWSGQALALPDPHRAQAS